MLYSVVQHRLPQALAIAKLPSIVNRIDRDVLLRPQVYEALPNFREDRTANAISDDLVIHLPMTESTIIDNQEARPFWTPRHLPSSMYLNLHRELLDHTHDRLPASITADPRGLYALSP